MHTHYPHQYPLSWNIDPQTQMILSQKTEQFYGVLFKLDENPLLDEDQFRTEFAKQNCFLVIRNWTEESVLSDISQILIACHFGILDSSLPVSIFSWISGAYAGLNRPLFILKRINGTPHIQYGNIRPTLQIPYETNEDIFRNLSPFLPKFFRNLASFNNFETSVQRFLERALEKLNEDQLNILRFLLLLDRNPYSEEEIIPPLRNYSERYLDIFLSDWSEFVVSVGILKKKEIQVPYGGLSFIYLFSEIHLPILRKILFNQRYIAPFEFPSSPSSQKD